MWVENILCQDKELLEAWKGIEADSSLATELAKKDTEIVHISVWPELIFGRIKGDTLEYNTDDPERFFNFQNLAKALYSSYNHSDERKAGSRISLTKELTKARLRLLDACLTDSMDLLNPESLAIEQAKINDLTTIESERLARQGMKILEDLLQIYEKQKLELAFDVLNSFLKTDQATTLKLFFEKTRGRAHNEKLRKSLDDFKIFSNQKPHLWA